MLGIGGDQHQTVDTTVRTGCRRSQPLETARQSSDGGRRSYVICRKEEEPETDCYHGDEDASRDPRSVEKRPHAKRGHPTHSTRFTDRRGYALWPSSLVWTCPETRCGQRHQQSDEPGHTWYQTTRTPQKDVEPITEGRDSCQMAISS